MEADRGAGRKHSIEIVATDDMAEYQYASEEAETAGRRHDERHARAIPRLCSLVPIADQKEGEEAGQFPKEDQLDQVARKGDPEHRAHERQQEREEARLRV